MTTHAVREKTGRGEFTLEVCGDGSMLVSLPGTTRRAFADARAVIDHYAPYAQGNPSAWNICYHAEDFLDFEGEG